MNIDQLSQLTQFRIDEQPHIVLNKDICKSCEHHACIHSCPANCYSFDEETKRVDVIYETCLECGTCYVICDKEAVNWSYPCGGYGVCFRLT